MNKDRITELYNRMIWDARLQEITRERIHWVCGQVRGESVLDVGCSQGIVPILLAREGRYVVGVDVNPESIEFAIQYQSSEFPNTKERCQFICADIFEYDLADKFDSLILTEILEHFSEPAVLLKRCLQFLKPKGQVVVTVPFGIHRDIDHKSTHTLKTVYSLLSEQCKVEFISVAGKYIQAVATLREDSENEEIGRETLIDLLEKTDQGMLNAESRHLDRIHELSDQVYHLNNKLIDLEKEQKKNADSEDAELKKLEKKIEDERGRAENLTEAFQSEKEKRLQLEKELNAAQAALKVSEESKEKFERDHHTLKLLKEIQQDTHSRAKLETQLEELRDELHQSRDRISGLESKLATEQATRAQQLTQIELLKQQLDYIEKQLSTEQEENNDLIRKRDELIERLHRAELSNESLRNNNQRLEGDIREARKEAHLLENRLRRVESDHRDALAEKSQVQQQLFRATKELDELQNQILLHQEKNAEDQQKIHSLHEELRLLRMKKPVPDQEQEQRVQALQAELEERNQAVSSLQNDLAHKRTLIDTLESRIQSLSSQQQWAEAEVQRLFAENQRKQSNYLRIKNSVGYQFGHEFLNAFFRPGKNTLRFPGRLLEIARTAKSAKQSTAPSANPSTSAEPKSLPADSKPVAPPPQPASIPTPVAAKPKLASAITASPAMLPHLDEPIQPLPFEAPANRTPLKLRIASIFDTFTEACFAPEAELLRVTPENWMESLRDGQPDMLFVESAWNGNDGAWLHRVAKYNAPPDNILADVISTCKKLGIPTVFWNKEDPPNFDRFVERAGEFDYVFTTDSNCLSAYQDKCPNVRHIAALPFAAQPRIHHPWQQVPRLNKSCFAGTYYADTYEERRAWMDTMLRAAAEHGLEIFDRMHNVTGDQKKRYLFPEDLRQHIRGKLDYEEMLEAYRRYRVFLNVNSVFDSPTMFSRRVFELLACGTPVITTPSLGIREFFGALVPEVETMAQVRAALQALLNDDEHWLRVSALGRRNVLTYHTYRHRLRTICEVAGLPTDSLKECESVMIVDPLHQPAELPNYVQHQRAKVDQIIVAGVPEREPNAQSCTEALSKLFIECISLPKENIPSFLRQRYPSAAVAICQAGRYYGPDYMLDAKHSLYGIPDGTATAIEANQDGSPAAEDRFGLPSQRAASGSLAFRATDVEKFLTHIGQSPVSDNTSVIVNRHRFDFA